MKQIALISIFLMSFSSNAQEFIGFKLNKYYLQSDLSNTLKNNKPTYHTNGQISLKIAPSAESKDLLVAENYDSKGKLIENRFIENKYDKPKWVSKKGREYEVDNYMDGRFLPPSANFPMNVKFDTYYNDIFDEYIGTLTSGTYYIGDRYELTGVFSPMILSIGNGTTVFVEDLVEKKYYWAIVVNDKIVKAYPAQKSEKPSLEELSKIENDYYNILNQKSVRKSKTLKQKHSLYDLESYRNYYSVAEINSPNSQNLTGYGVKTEINDRDYTASYRKVQVGIFKNGKLSGVGYECIYDKRSRSFISKYNNRFDGRKKIGVRVTSLVDFKYGFFKEGVFTQGFENKDELENYSWKDFWQPTSYENVKYSNNGMKIYNVPANKKPVFHLNGLEPKPFSSISTYDQIYIFSLNRVFNIYKVDYNKKEITLQSDVAGKYFTIKGDGDTKSSYSNAKFLLVKKETETKTLNCTPIEIPIYEKVARSVSSTQRSYIGSTSHIKDGVRYTYSAQPGKVVTSTVYENKLVGYRKEYNKGCDANRQYTVQKDNKSGYLFNF